MHVSIEELMANKEYNDNIKDAAKALAELPANTDE